MAENEYCLASSQPDCASLERVFAVVTSGDPRGRTAALTAGDAAIDNGLKFVSKVFPTKCEGSDGGGTPSQAAI